MIKRIVVLFIACSLLLLCSCQLADPNAGSEIYVNLDQMVGVFITTEYLDLFDIETYLQDNIGSIQNGVISDNDPKYSGKIYASPVEHGYAFPDLEGILFASFWIKTDAEGYWSGVVSGDGLSDISRKYASTDAGTAIEHSANIYVPSNTGEVIFYFNPVYQTPEGDVYLASGTGISITGISMNTATGTKMTQALHGDTKISEGAQTTGYTYDLEVSVYCIDIPNAVTYIQMDAQHQVLRKETFLPGQLPEEFTPLENTSYILVEEEYKDGVVRSVNQPGSETIEVFYLLENGLCVKDQTAVLWNPS